MITKYASQFFKAGYGPVKLDKSIKVLDSDKNLEPVVVDSS